MWTKNFNHFLKDYKSCKAFHIPECSVLSVEWCFALHHSPKCSHCRKIQSMQDLYQLVKYSLMTAGTGYMLMSDVTRACM